MQIENSINNYSLFCGTDIRTHYFTVKYWQTSVVIVKGNIDVGFK